MNDKWRQVVPFQPVPGTVRVNFFGFNDSLVWENVMHWTYTGAGPSSGDLDKGAQLFFEAYGQELMPLAAEAVTLQSVTLTDLATQTGAEGSYAGVSPGTAPGANLGAQVCSVVSKQTSYRYRGGHGRSYLPTGTQPNLETSGTWLPNYGHNLVVGYQNFVDEVGNGQAFTTIGQEVIVHRVADKVHLPSAFVTPITGYIAQLTLGTQRRRVRN
jgi:hypothetical protein